MATIQINDELGRLIEAKASEYGYADASAYVTDLIRRDKARSEWLTFELNKGLESGISPYTIEEAIEAGYEQARRNCA